ncbi:homeobox protein NANOG [Notolabrus celidotus]|uniref:homeobox protein NANOG n=1 Tax=Notolabrus celidotus TaxID=1203425 RepID=UPI0014901691|nr:homeobox protein NANOG [Notolabrus celidotus]
MADWKPQISYNYNPSYHAYAYGLVFQPGPEQNHGNLSSWGEAGDLSNYNPGVSQAYYTPTTRTREDSPPCSPEDHAMNRHYQGSGMVYLGDSQTGRLVLAGPHQAAYTAREHEASRADSTSDSEAHTSPDSWRSGSSREGGLPQTDPVTWGKKDLDDETSSRSPDASEDVSSSFMEEPRTFVITGNDSTNKTAPLHAPMTAPKSQSTTAVSNPKGKVRAAFSETQMNTLVQRFSVQRYLTPAEMKNLAELTGLTYKQVKTWFQNRRMKLRRHQKDNGWAPERYNTNKESPVRGAMYHNIPPHIPPYQGEVRPQSKEHYNQHMMESAFKKNVPQNLAFYLAAMSSTAGSTGYPSWPSGSQQIVMPTRPQAAGWSLQPGVAAYEYNHNAFNSVSTNNTERNTSFEDKDGEPVSLRSSTSPVIVQNVSQ